MFRELLVDFIKVGSGGIKVANGAPIVGRNAANTADIPIAYIDGADELIIGDLGNSALVIYAGGINYQMGAGGTGTGLMLANEITFQGGSQNTLLSLYDLTSTNKLSISVGTLSGTSQWILANGNGTAGQVLSTDGNNPAQLAWIDPGQSSAFLVRVAATNEVDISSAPAAIDGVTLNPGDLVLLTYQNTSSHAENGIYVFNNAGDPLLRATGWDTAADWQAGFTIFTVDFDGERLGHTMWTIVHPISTIDTDSIDIALTGWWDKGSPFSLHLHNNDNIRGRNFANSADIQMLSLDTSDNVKLGDPDGGSYIQVAPSNGGTFVYGPRLKSVDGVLSTLSQSGLIGSPAEGDLQINTDSGYLNYYSNTGWHEVGPSNIGPTWIRFSKTYSDFSAASTTNDIELFSLPGSSLIHGVTIHHSTAFTGGAVSAVTVSVGITGQLDKYATAWDVFQAPDDAIVQTTNDLGLENMTSATSIRAAIVSTDDNLDQLTQGQVEIWLLVSTLSA